MTPCVNNAGWDTMFQSKFDELRWAKAAREKRNISLREIARESGLSLGTLQRVSTGNLESVNMSTLAGLCRYFAVRSISELVEYVPDEPQQSITYNHDRPSAADRVNEAG